MAYFHTTVLDNQIKALPTVSTASGSIATFETDMTENLVEVKCQIVAKQGGSGTPSPSNPRPITTYTEMNVSACGKNLLNTAISEQTITSQRRILQSYPMKQGTYCISFKGVNSGSVVGYFNIESTYETAVRINIPLGADDRYSGTITLTRDQNIAILCNGQMAGYNYKVSDIQIETGSQPTEYVANGTTANIPFGQTVANGVLDVTTGVLTVTHRIFFFDGSVSVDSLGYASGLNFVRVKQGMQSVNSTASNLVMSDKFQGTPSTFSIGACFITSGGNVLIAVLPDQTITTKIGATQWFSDNNTTFVYPLATPQEIQLDSITLQALLNENNIWCDTGDTSVKYILSVGKAIS